MGPIGRREIINDMTYAISKNRHATWAHFKIDMEITKIVTRDVGFFFNLTCDTGDRARTQQRVGYSVCVFGGGGGVPPSGVGSLISAPIVVWC